MFIKINLTGKPKSKISTKKKQYLITIFQKTIAYSTRPVIVKIEEVDTIQKKFREDRYPLALYSSSGKFNFYVVETNEGIVKGQKLQTLQYAPSISEMVRAIFIETHFWHCRIGTTQYSYLKTFLDV